MNQQNTSAADAVQSGRMPMIAWIMPVYNGERYIRQAIESILLQPCKDCAVWVVDDGSTDATAQIVNAIPDDRVHYIYQENTGVSAARNNGMRSSRSQYIGFLDADDVLCRDAYDEEIHGILEDGKYDLLSFSYYDGNKKLNRGKRRPVVPGEYSCKEREYEGFRQLGSYLFKRNAFFSSSNTILFPEEIRISEDEAFRFLTLRTGGQMCYSDRDWMIYRANPSSVMNSRTSGDYLIDEEVESWHWCKQQCDNEEDKARCDNWILITVMNYIIQRVSANAPVEEIVQKIQNSSFPETWKNYDALWPGNRMAYEKFITDPKAYRRSIWKERVRLSASRLLLRFPNLREALRYREDISARVYPASR